jgi:hypothetical protein
MGKGDQQLGYERSLSIDKPLISMASPMPARLVLQEGQKHICPVYKSGNNVSYRACHSLLEWRMSGWVDG